MKKVLIILFVLLLFLGGCSNAVVKTPPWNEQELERMQAQEIRSVPLLIIEW